MTLAETDAPFVPEQILPVQMSRGHRRDSLASGEKALMLAILEDAIRCVQGRSRDRRKGVRELAREAEAWVRSDDVEWPCSFRNVCEALALDPATLRRGILALRPEVGGGTVYRLHLRLKKAEGMVMPPVALRALG